MQEDSVDIFSESFEPTKLTKLQLRSLLLKYDILDVPPMSHKKEELVEMLIKKVIEPAVELAKAKKTITTEIKRTPKKKASVAPSSHGITFLDGSGRTGSPIAPSSFENSTETV